MIWSGLEVRFTVGQAVPENRSTCLYAFMQACLWDPNPWMDSSTMSPCFRY